MLNTVGSNTAGSRRQAVGGKSRERRANAPALVWPEKPRKFPTRGLGAKQVWESACTRFRIIRHTRGSKRYTVWIYGEQWGDYEPLYCRGRLATIQGDFKTLAHAKREAQHAADGARMRASQRQWYVEVLRWSPSGAPGWRTMGPFREVQVARAILREALTLQGGKL